VFAKFNDGSARLFVWPESRGIAVLGYEKRGVGGSTGDFTTIEDWLAKRVRGFAARR
jgi:hypothetical protein